MRTWEILVMAAASIALMMVIWMEVRRRNRHQLGLRIVAVLVAVTSVACIALGPAFMSSEPLPRQAILITSGSLDAKSITYLSKNKANIPVLVTEDSLKRIYRRFHPSLLADIASFKETDTLHILGDGTEQFTAPPAYKIIFHAAALTSGFESAGWSRQLKSGELLKVQGIYRNLLPVPVLLILTGFGMNADSVSIAPGHTSGFELKTIPRFLGHATYTLQTKTSGVLKKEGPVPVEIMPDLSPRVLILNDAPSYENKYLNDWLSQNQYLTAMRTRISIHKFYTQLSKGLAVSPEHLTRGLLKKFDLLIADNASIASLEPQELAVLRQAIQTDGLGLIIQLDSSSTGSRSSLSPVQVHSVAAGADSLSSLFMDAGDHSEKKIPLMPVRLGADPSSRTLVQDKKENLLASLRVMGRGRLIYTVIGQSYTWLLNANSADYGKLWSLLIGKASRTAAIQEKLSTGAEFPEADHPLLVSLICQATGIPGLHIGRVSLALKQDKLDASLWSAVCWPRNEGWIRLTTKKGDSFWFYVFKDQDWAGLKASMLRKRMKVLEHDSRLIQTAPVRFNQVKIPVSMTWFWLAFLFSMTYLWVERKLFPAAAANL